MAVYLKRMGWDECNVLAWSCGWCLIDGFCLSLRGHAI